LASISIIVQFAKGVLGQSKDKEISDFGLHLPAAGRDFGLRIVNLKSGLFELFGHCILGSIWNLGLDFKC